MIQEREQAAIGWLKELGAAVSTQSTKCPETLGNRVEHAQTGSRLPHLIGEVSFSGGGHCNTSHLSVYPSHEHQSQAEGERKAHSAPAKEAGASLGQVLLVHCPHLSHAHPGDVPIFCTDRYRLSLAQD